MSNGDVPKSQAALLAELLDQHRISVRRLARIMASSNDQKDVEKERRNLTRWLSATNGISDPNAERLVGAFRAAGVILPADYFKKRRGPRTWQDRMEDRVRELQTQVDDLMDRLRGSA